MLPLCTDLPEKQPKDCFRQGVFPCFTAVKDEKRAKFNSSADYCHLVRHLFWRLGVLIFGQAYQ